MRRAIYLSDTGRPKDFTYYFRVKEFPVKFRWLSEKWEANHQFKSCLKEIDGSFVQQNRNLSDKNLGTPLFWCLPLPHSDIFCLKVNFFSSTTLRKQRGLSRAWFLFHQRAFEKKRKIPQSLIAVVVLIYCLKKKTEGNHRRDRSHSSIHQQEKYLQRQRERDTGL